VRYNISTTDDNINEYNAVIRDLKLKLQDVEKPNSSERASIMISSFYPTNGQLKLQNVKNKLPFMLKKNHSPGYNNHENRSLKSIEQPKKMVRPVQ
jgi:hypothetical protein